jgi:hypothetical protein
MPLFKSDPEIKRQGPWKITIYNSIMNKGSYDEYDDRYIEFHHIETGVSFKREMAFIKGQSHCSEKEPLKLIDIWNQIKKYTPGSSSIVYGSWVITRWHDHSEYSLISKNELEPRIKYHNIIGDYTSNKMDFAAFLNMLDKQEEIVLSSEKKSILNIDEARIKRAE